jgi:hypothetical protein
MPLAGIIEKFKELWEYEIFVTASLVSADWESGLSETMLNKKISVAGDITEFLNYCSDDVTSIRDTASSTSALSQTLLIHVGFSIILANTKTIAKYFFICATYT